MGNPQLKSVDSQLNEGTPAMTLEQFNTMKAALLAQLQQLNKAGTGLREQQEAQTADIRYHAFRVRKEMEPLEEEYDRLSNEYTDIIGSPGVNPDGSRKLAKIKFSAEEKERFLSRWQAENKRK